MAGEPQYRARRGGWMRRMVKEGKLKVVAAKYDLDDGKVSLLEEVISKQSPASPENAL